MSQQTELNAIEDTFQKITFLCYERCIKSPTHPQYSEERSCNENCVSKYMSVHRMVGAIVQKVSQPSQGGFN
ncbi:mitochondrial import inner membrane translocase subunit TIM10 [Acrasis kona]|uniref:Mitochondrial import inner membrane translocase subunit n=1 Tax=Acrasis kona TaxID=1008807 RepID=A0AAW2Z169_9EUKA